MTSEITWKGQPDDQMARIGDYMLRVEEMYAGAWWWCVYYKEIQVAVVYKLMPNTLFSAKTACEKAYQEHLKTR